MYCEAHTVFVFARTVVVVVVFVISDVVCVLLFIRYKEMDADGNGEIDMDVS